MKTYTASVTVTYTFSIEAKNAVSAEAIATDKIVAELPAFGDYTTVVGFEIEEDA